MLIYQWNSLFRYNNMEENIDKIFIITQKIKRPKSSKGLSKIEALYEEVIQKNFQTIDELLRRLSHVVSRHDEFETQFQLLSKRLSKLQNDLETIHNEHRRDNLHIASNINGIRTQIVGIDTQFKILFDKVQHKGFSSFLQQKFRLKKKQSLDNEGLLFSNHKLGESSSFLNFEAADKGIEIELQKQIQNQGLFDQTRAPCKLQVTPSIKHSQVQLKNQSELKKQEQGKQNNFNLNIPTHAARESQALDLKESVPSNKQNPTIKNSIFITQKHEEQSILHYLEKLTELCTQSKQIEEDAKVQILASFARHKSKISSLLKQTSKKDIDVNQARTNFYNAIDHILSNDQILNSKVSKPKFPSKISEQISEILFENFYEKMAIQEQTRISVREAVGKEILDLNIQIQELKKKDIKMNELEQNFKTKMRQLTQQLRSIEQKSDKWITQDQLFDETVRVVQKSQKKWEDCHFNFANKEETIKAISFLSSKINVLACNLGQTKLNPSTKIDQNIQTKCICCTSTINRSHTPRKMSSTMRSSGSNGHVVRILKPNQIKKKTLELLKTNKSLQSSSFFNY